MSKHLILGDVHLDKGLKIGKPPSGAKLNSRITDQQELMIWVLDQAIAEAVSSIIITGDIYQEPRPHPGSIRFFMTWLKKCEKANIDVHIVAGNHDIMRTGSYTVSALDIVPAVEISKAKTYKDVKTIDYPGVSFTFLPFRDRRMYDADSPEKGLQLLKKELSDSSQISKENINVLIGHLTLAGALHVGDEIDDMLNELFCPTDMFKEYDYVWMGHIHKPQVLNSSKPYLAHIGSMDRSDFSASELDHDKIIIIFDTDSQEKFKHIIIPTRPLRKVEISVTQDKDTTNFIINELHAINNEKSLSDAIVRVEIQLEGQETPNADREKILKFLYQNLNAHYICNFSESRNITVVFVNAQTMFDNNMTVSSAIDAFIDSVKFDSDNEKIDVQKLAIECFEELKQKLELRTN
jgi:exonuclease SbcD